MKSIEIEVPATSANLGPGFDTLGLALGIVNKVTVSFSETDSGVALEEVGDHGESPWDANDNPTCRAYRAWGEAEGEQLPGATFKTVRSIPGGRGMGSSGAAIVAGLMAGAHVTKTQDSRRHMLNLAAKLEGHADNTTAALMGGLTVSFRQGDDVRALHVANHLEMRAVLFVPSQGLDTKRARQVLPKQIDFDDAVFSLGRSCYLITALAWGHWDRIAEAMCDQLHQPARRSLIPAFPRVIESALEAGAYGAALSGGGPSVIALCDATTADTVARAIELAASSAGWSGESLTTHIRDRGAELRELPD